MSLFTTLVFFAASAGMTEPLDATDAVLVARIKSAGWCGERCTAAINLREQALDSLLITAPEAYHSALLTNARQSLGDLVQLLESYHTDEYREAAAANEMIQAALVYRSDAAIAWPNDDERMEIAHRRSNCQQRLKDLLEKKSTDWPERARSIVLDRLHQRFAELEAFPYSSIGRLRFSDQQSDVIVTDFESTCDEIKKLVAALEKPPSDSTEFAPPPGFGASREDQAVIRLVVDFERSFSNNLHQASLAQKTRLSSDELQAMFPDLVRESEYWSRRLHQVEAAEHQAFEAAESKASAKRRVEMQDPERLKAVQQEARERMLREQGPFPELVFRKPKHTHDPPHESFSSRSTMWIVGFILVAIAVLLVGLRFLQRN